MKYKNKSIQISCDGGAATGKSTGAKMISKKYNLKFLSSGLLYRYAAYLILRHKPENKVKFLRKKFYNLNIYVLKKLNLHTPMISKYSSIIAKQKNIRDILKKFQINFSKKYKNCCIEGRDISTKILPKSDLKFFFVCSANIAAFRRYKELKKINKKTLLKDVKKALIMRNNLDRERKHSPLLKHRNSIVIDTGKLSKPAVLAKMSKHIDKVIKQKKNEK